MLPTGIAYSPDLGVMPYTRQPGNRTSVSLQNIQSGQTVGQQLSNNSDNPVRDISLYKNGNCESLGNEATGKSVQHRTNASTVNNNSSHSTIKRQLYFGDNKQAQTPIHMLPVSFPNAGPVPCWQGLIVGAVVNSNGRMEIQPLGELPLHGYLTQPAAAKVIEQQVNTGTRHPRKPTTSDGGESRAPHSRRFEAGSFLYDAGNSDTAFNQQRLPILMSSSAAGDSGTKLSDNRTSTTSTYDIRGSNVNQNGLLLMLSDDTNNYNHHYHKTSGENVPDNNKPPMQLQGPVLNNQFPSYPMQTYSEQNQLISNLNDLPTNLKQQNVYAPSDPSSLDNEEGLHRFQTSNCANSRVQNSIVAGGDVQNSIQYSSWKPHNTHDAEPTQEFQTNSVNSQVANYVIPSQNNTNSVPYSSCRPLHFQGDCTQPLQAGDIVNPPLSTATCSNVDRSSAGQVFPNHIIATQTKSLPSCSLQDEYIDHKQTFETGNILQNIVSDKNKNQTIRKLLPHLTHRHVDQTQTCPSVSTISSGMQNSVPGVGELTLRRLLSYFSSVDQKQTFPSVCSRVQSAASTCSDMDQNVSKSVVLCSPQASTVNQTLTFPAYNGTSQTQASNGPTTGYSTIKTLPFSSCRPCTVDHPKLIPACTTVSSQIQNFDLGTSVEQNISSELSNYDSHMLLKCDNGYVQQGKQFGNLNRNCISEKGNIHDIVSNNREGMFRVKALQGSCFKNDKTNKNRENQNEVLDGQVSGTLKQRREILQGQIAYLRTRKSTMTKQSVSILTEMKKDMSSKQSETEYMDSAIYSDTETLSVQSGSDYECTANNKTHHSHSTKKKQQRASDSTLKVGSHSKKCRVSSSCEEIGGESGLDNNNCMTMAQVQVKHKQTKRRKKSEKTAMKKIKPERTAMGEIKSIVAPVQEQAMIPTTVIDLTCDEGKCLQPSYSDPQILETKKTSLDQGYSSFFMDEETNPSMAPSILESSSDMSRQIDEALLSSMYQADNIDLSDGMLTSGILDDSQSWQPSEIFDQTPEKSPVASQGDVVTTHSSSKAPNVNYPSMSSTIPKENSALVSVDNSYFRPAQNAFEALLSQTDEMRFTADIKSAESTATTSTPAITKAFTSVWVPNSETIMSDTTTTSCTDSCADNSCYTSIGTNSSSSCADTVRTELTRTSTSTVWDQNNLRTEGASVSSCADPKEPKTEKIITTLIPTQVLNETSRYFKELEQVTSDVTGEWKIANCFSLKTEVGCRENFPEHTISIPISDSHGNSYITTQCPSISSTSTGISGNMYSNHSSRLKKKAKAKRKQTINSTSGIPKKMGKKDSIENDGRIVNFNPEIISPQTTGNVQNTNCENFMPSPDSRQTFLSPSSLQESKMTQEVACPYVGCRFHVTSRCHLRRHLFAHMQYYPYECSLCPHKSVQMSNVKTHWKSHRSRSFQFTYNRRLDVETKIDGMIEKAFKDGDFEPQNIIGTNEKLPLKESVIGISEKESVFLCKYCNKVCTKVHYLKLHMSYKHKGLPLGYPYKPNTNSEKRQVIRKMNKTQSNASTDGCRRNLTVAVEEPQKTVDRRDKKQVRTPYRKLFCDDEDPLKTEQHISINTHATEQSDITPGDRGQHWNVKIDLRSEMVAKQEDYFRVRIECPMPDCHYTAQYRSVKMHIYTHFEYHPFMCGYCKSSCSQISEIKKHMRMRHAENEPLYTIQTDRNLEEKLATIAHKLWEKVQSKRQISGKDKLKTTGKNETHSDNYSVKKMLPHLDKVYSKPEVYQDTLVRLCNSDVPLFETSPLGIQDREWQELNFKDALNIKQETTKDVRKCSPKLIGGMDGIHTPVCNDTSSVQHNNQGAPRLHVVKKKFGYRCYCGMKFNWRCRLGEHHVTMHPCKDAHTGYFLCQYCNFMSVFPQGVKIHHGRKHPEETFDFDEICTDESLKTVSKLGKPTTVQMENFLELEINTFQMLMSKAGVSDVNIDNLPADEFNKFLGRCFVYEESKRLKNTMLV